MEVALKDLLSDAFNLPFDKKIGGLFVFYKKDRIVLWKESIKSE